MRLLKKLAAKHPDGVDSTTLRSTFVLEMNNERERSGKNLWTSDQGRSAFHQTLTSLRDRELVEGGDDTLLPSE
jgi:hypothetical protein